jgi:hypothetical protein
VTTESCKGCRAAPFKVKEVVVPNGEDNDEDDGGDEDEDGGREEDEDNGREEDEDNDGGTESEMVPESNVVEIGLGWAVSTEGGMGIEEVNSGTGCLNEPPI